MRTWLRRALAACGLVLATLIAGYGVYTRLAFPELRPWHRLRLREEFHAGQGVRTFEDYRRLETTAGRPVPR